MGNPPILTIMAFAKRVARQARRLLASRLIDAQGVLEVLAHALAGMEAIDQAVDDIA